MIFTEPEILQEQELIGVGIQCHPLQTLARQTISNDANH